MRLRMPRTPLVLALALTALACAAPARAVVAPLPGQSVARMQATLSGAMRRAGPFSGAYVVDYGAGQPLFSLRAGVLRNPASVEKLYTTSTALSRFGLDGRLDTLVLTSVPPDAHGVVKGDLYLRGGGDPTFGSEHFANAAYGGGATVTALAQALQDTAGVSRVQGSVFGDESLFDSLRGGPSTSFRLDSEIGDLSALAFDRGLTGGLASPAAYAASQLAAALRGEGVPVRGQSGAATAPPTATLAATVASPPMRTLVQLTNQSSDNFFAETLLKDLGAHFGQAGSTSAGAAVVRQWLAPLHIAPRVVDGSGLSRSDYTSPQQVVDLLRAVAVSPLAVAMRTSLPVAGRSGTLRYRMRGTAAAGRCSAKTGTLSDVSALAGWCGTRIAFAFLMNRLSVSTAHALQDRMTSALAKLG
ncbi:MAG: hypothetical protein NVSMB51_13720 [Solirubrobacteraceae bacterium]